MPDLPATWTILRPPCGPGRPPKLLRLRLYENLPPIFYVDVQVVPAQQRHANEGRRIGHVGNDLSWRGASIIAPETLTSQLPHCATGHARPN